MNEGFIFDTPEQISHYRMASAIAALKIEVKTGMKMGRGSILKFVQQQYGIKAKTKAKALDEMLVLHKATYGWDYGVKQ